MKDLQNRCFGGMRMQDAILIVDDATVIRKSLRALFENHYEVFEAKDGLDAWNLLNERPVSLILLDLIMPVMDGIDLLKKIRATDVYKDLPVIIITSSEETEKLVEAFQAGATDYIVKPFLPKITVFRVNNALMANRRMLHILEEERQLKRKAELDLLTNLYNKVTVEEKINVFLSAMSETLCALFIFDIDDFKQINDDNGHVIGDHVLRVVADTLSSHFRSGDILGRIGGDEFVALMIDIPSRRMAIEKAEELVDLMNQGPSPTPVAITMSIGIAFNDQQPVKFLELYNEADRALYQAKNEGKSTYCVFEP